MAVSKRLRYEVFRRDNHACRYCGAAAPDATLTIDHVVPVALGGTDDPANLVTACKDCNAGKSSSGPNTSVVADVSADAIRWGNAMTVAAEILLSGSQERADQHNEFAAMWNTWGYGPAHDRRKVPLDPGWRSSVDSFLAAGLTLPILSECIDIAMGAGHVATESRFRYMCGIAWNKVAELREVAASLIEAQGSDVASHGQHVEGYDGGWVCGCGCGRPWTAERDPAPHPPPPQVKEQIDRFRQGRG